VISINAHDFSILLSGDISRVVEQRLVNRGLGQHTILTAPHHGSSTSSSKTLIDAVNPSLALISAATNNRFGFPRADVLQRYANAGIPTLNTASCGGIRVTNDDNGEFRMESARIRQRAIWRWPGGVDCP
jgi:competence protein ComEC